MRWQPKGPSCMRKEGQTSRFRAQECYAYSRFRTRIGSYRIGNMLFRAVYMMTSPPPPPTPTHILRSHTSPISALCISPNNQRIYTGDASGTIVVTSTLTLRPIAKWGAHKEGILGVEEWGQAIVTSVWRERVSFFCWPDANAAKQPREG